MTFRATGMHAEYMEGAYNIDDPIYQEMLKTLKETMSKEYHIYAFKEPVLEDERDLQVQLVKETNFILKDYSKNFCELVYDNTGIEKNDQVCLKKWKESRHWLQ
jgi:hypothetical protein